MKKNVLTGIMILLLAHAVQAQSGRYLIQLRNKAQNPYSLSRPEQFLSARSMERRARYGIAYDSTDLPVTPHYIASIRAIPNVVVLNVSKWLNQVSVQLTEASALSELFQLPFVHSVTFIASRMQPKKNIPETHLRKLNDPKGIQSLSTIEGAFDYGAAAAQVGIHNGPFLHNIGLQGHGMIISLLDAGFYQYTALHAFDSVNRNGQVLGTWDFVAREESVAEDDPHGMQCFSVIAATIPGLFTGTAPKASFYLFRSEDAASEYPIEEHNWVCAAEHADSAGSDVISSSLGYYHFNEPSLNYSYDDMNGDTAIATRGADVAAKKGVLVVAAAGNEGASGWKYVIAPADGDSVLAVGAITATGEVAAFSSYGPAADGRIKPDVVSVGVSTIIQGANNTIVAGNGTSFACPNIAGPATCLWQGFPEYDNIKMIDALRRSAHLFQTPNDRVGYGTPDVKKAVRLLLEDFATASVTDCNTLTWTSKDASSMHYEIERQKKGERGFTKIGEQSGTGALFQTHSYRFVDSSLSAMDGLVWYRIRQILDTSTAAFFDFYIDTLPVAMTGCTPVPLSEGGVQIVPNPVTEPFYVKIENGAPVSNLQMIIVTAIGQTVYTAQTSKAAGLAVIPVHATGFAPGLYYLLVYDGTKKLAAKPFLKL